MFDLFRRVWFYWRHNGLKRTVRAIVDESKARLGRRVPWVAGLSGPGPARTRMRPREIVDSRFPACVPLRTHALPRAEKPRVSMVTDSINSGYLYGGVGTAMILSALLAEARGARLRIITRLERARHSNLEHVLGAYGIELGQEAAFEFAPSFDPAQDIGMVRDELFVTTSWWTTAAIMPSVPRKAMLYLLQEDERMFYPFGDERLRCVQVLQSRDIHFAINTRMLYDHFVADGLEHFQRQAAWFEPAFPGTVFRPRGPAAPGKRTLLFYARPNNLRNLFYFGLELLDRAVGLGVVDLEQWEIVLVGRDVPRVVFQDGREAARHENLSWMQYAELVGSVDLGLSLMDTPHPSYPPLDLAASGAVVVTNRHGRKQDLGMYSKNIICGDLTMESMLVALAEGVALAADHAARAANHGASRIGTDWREALSPVVRRFGTVP